MITKISVLNLKNGIDEGLMVEDLKDIIDGLFGDAYKAMTEAQITQDILSITNVVTANNGSRIYAWLGSVPNVQEWITTKLYQQLKEYNYVVRNKQWYNAITLSKTDLRRNGLVDVPMLLQGLLREHQNHKKEMLIEALIKGHQRKAYDDVTFFSNKSGIRKNDNLLAGTGTTSAQIKADIVSARKAMMKFVNDKGQMIRLVPDTVICPVSLESTFLQLQKSVVDPNSTNNTANIVSGYINKIITDPLLDNADANDWYYCASGASLKPLILQTETMNSGNEFETVLDETKLASDGIIGYSVESASAVGYGLPALAVKIVNS